MLALSILAGLLLKSDRGRGQGGQQYPIIIRQISLENQTVTSPLVHLFTPTTSGLYRLSGYMNASTQSSGSACPLFTWFDEVGSQLAIFSGPAGICATAGAEIAATAVVHARANEPVNLNTSLEGFTGTYNVFITVEQLQ